MRMFVVYTSTILHEYMYVCIFLFVCFYFFCRVTTTGTAAVVRISEESTGVLRVVQIKDDSDRWSVLATLLELSVEYVFRSGRR